MGGACKQARRTLDSSRRSHPILYGSGACDGHPDVHHRIDDVRRAGTSGWPSQASEPWRIRIDRRLVGSVPWAIARGSWLVRLCMLTVAVTLLDIGIIIVRPYTTVASLMT